MVSIDDHFATTITGPASPWINETQLNTGTGIGNVGQTAGYQITTSTGAATYSGTLSGTAGWSAAVVTLLPQLSTTTSGGVSMSGTMTMAGTALGGNTTTSGGVSMSGTMKMAGTDSEIFSSTGAMSMSSLAMAGTGYQSLPFPKIPIGVKIEILVNGTWTDITQYMQQRADMVIGYGRPDQSSNGTSNPASLNFTLNNRDGRFSPKNASGAYYPFITRNTQLRVSVIALSTLGTLYSGYRFWGEVPAWPPSWDTTGSDVYVSITANGVLRRLNQSNKTAGSALWRYYSKLTGSIVPVACWPGEDASTATQIASIVPGGAAMTFTGTPSLASDTSFPGSDALPQMKGASFTGSTAAGGVIPSPALYDTPGTYTWTCPGDVTSITSAECWGAAGGGGGTGNQMQAGGTGATSTFAGDAVTVTAHGGHGGGGNTGVGGTGGTGGTGSGNDTHHNGGAGAAGDNSGNFGGGGGGSGGSAAAGNAASGGTGGAAVTGGGPGANGPASGGTGSAGFLPTSGPAGGGSGGQISTVPAGGGGGGGEYAKEASVAVTPGNGYTVVVGAGAAGGLGAFNGGSGYAGQVKLTYTSAGAPAANVFRFLLDVPSTGGVNGAIHGEMLGAGTITKVDVVYGTGGTLTVNGYAGVTLKFTHTSGNIANGVPMMVSVSLVQSGANVNWSFDYITPGGSATNISSGTVTTASVSTSSTVNGNVSGTETGAVGTGWWTVQYAVDPLSNLSAPLNAYLAERAATRLSRLCGEEGFGFELTGNASDSAQMGYQTDEALITLLQECEDADLCLLYESRDQFGLAYTTRVALQNQSSTFTLDYASQQLGETVPQPTDDEYLTRNDAVISRPNGSSWESTVTVGALSVQDPPNGVGFYSYSNTVNLHQDSQLQNYTTWLTTIGTVDDFRWPVIEVSLARTALAGALFSQVPSAFIGDMSQITNPPSFVQSNTVKQLVYGYKETINAFTWRFAFNEVPESPYEGAGLPTW
jgi:hypothetical protein